MPRKKTKKSLLVALVSFALAGSTAFAMPTGGKVIQGNVTGIVNGTVSSGGTIHVKGSSLIDWQGFSIGNGERLNFNFVGSGANQLINHVSGNDISRLLGTLNTTGEGGFMLINPNGIVIGPNASINVGSLMLSTLDVSLDQCKNWLHFLDSDSGSVRLEFKNTKNGVVDIQGGKISVEDTLKIYGTKIQIADGVTISNGLQLMNADGTMVHPASENGLYGAEMIAADKIVKIKDKTLGSNNPSDMTIESTADNVISIGKAHIKNDGYAFYLSMDAGAVTMNGTNINLVNPQWANRKGGPSRMGIAVENMYNNRGRGYEVTADNVIRLKDVSLSTDGYDYMVLSGGTISLDNTKMENSKGISIDAVNMIQIMNGSVLTAEAHDRDKYAVAGNGEIVLIGGNVKVDKSAISGGSIEMHALTEESYDENTPKITYHATEDNTLIIQDSKLTAVDDIVGTGGTVAVYGKSSLDARDATGKETNQILLAAGKDVVLETRDDEDSLISADGMVTLSESVKASLDRAKAHNARVVLSKYEIVSDDMKIDMSFEDLVEDLNAILQDSRMTEAERKEKALALLKQYEPIAALDSRTKGKLDQAVSSVQSWIGGAITVSGDDLVMDDGDAEKDAVTIKE